MTPTASVSQGLYFAHPQADHLAVGRVGKDQIRGLRPPHGRPAPRGGGLAPAEPGLRLGRSLKAPAKARYPRAMTEARRILAVVFDAVGTLLLLREPVGETYARFALPYGVTLPAGRLQDAFTRVLAAAPPNLHPGVPLAVARRARARLVARARARDVPRAADGTARFDDFEAFFGRLWTPLRGGARLAARRRREGARCLESLAARGLRLGVLSNFDQRLRRVLGAPRPRRTLRGGDAAR